MKAVVQTTRGVAEVVLFCLACFLVGFIGGQILQAVLA